jgi:AcrR family transcriptional regulator
VRATIRCLAREGYSGLTMKKVAREAGVSQGILHYYFADKRAILVAALERVMADLNQRVAREARGTRDPRQRLRALIAACLSVATEAREFWVVFVEFWGEMMHDRTLSRINADLYAHIRRLIGSIVAQGTRAGRFRRVNPEHAGAVVLALVDGLSLQLAFDPKAFSLASATRLCEDAVRRYLER